MAHKKKTLLLLSITFTTCFSELDTHCGCSTQIVCSYSLSFNKHCTDTSQWLLSNSKHTGLIKAKMWRKKGHLNSVWLHQSSLSTTSCEVAFLQREVKITLNTYGVAGKKKKQSRWTFHHILHCNEEGPRNKAGSHQPLTGCLDQSNLCVQPREKISRGKPIVWH